jgi:hypothetical protein
VDRQGTTARVADRFRTLARYPGATVYFTSEAAAREGERREPPAGVSSEQDSLVREVTYFDLRQPWLLSPRTSG